MHPIRRQSVEVAVILPRSFFEGRKAEINIPECFTILDL